jgi:tetratricopeptide (TPR) repeat protein
MVRGIRPAPKARLDDVRRLMARGELALAARRCEQLLRLSPGDPAVQILAAELQLLSGRRDDAVKRLNQVARESAADAATLTHCAVLLMKAGEGRESLRVALQAEALPIRSIAVSDALAAVLTHQGEALRALPHALRAVQGAPENVTYRFNLAMIQRMVGDFDAAESNLNIVIESRPQDAEAYLTRSGLRTQSPSRNHVAQLESVLAGSPGTRARIPLGFALAKELEDLGEYERSFSQLTTACGLHRATYSYDVNSDLAVIEALTTLHSKAAIERIQADSPIDEPVFIMGLPRSGTTLVDRMLGSHPDVFSAGELNAFPETLISALNRTGQLGNKRDLVERSLRADIGSLGGAYLDATRPRTGHTPKFTDKLPLNYLYASLIHAALPKARFIVLRRNPMDSCYAMYKTLFVGAYPFSYDLEELGRYFVAWDRLMNHWERLLGDSWLSVAYEDLVSSPEEVTRRMLAHCGLSWNDACLAFHTSGSPVSTASAVQVRRPIYRDSVGKWRLFEQGLRPLAHLFDTHGIHY